MSGIITKEAYQKLVDEDIAWLKQQPRTLERDHVIEIVSNSVTMYYDELAALRERLKQLETDKAFYRDKYLNTQEKLDAAEQENIRLKLP